MDVAMQRNVPVLMTEYNSVACGGSNISSTVSFSWLLSYLESLNEFNVQFGAALWAIDVGLKAASMNYTAVYLHTREYGVQYNLFDPPTPEDSISSGWRTGSPYYSALFLTEVGDPTGSVIVDLDLQNSTTDQSATIAGYGVYTDAGRRRDRLVILNYASPTSADEDAIQQFHIPVNLTHKVFCRILTAPDVTEKTNITWAGQTVGQNGDLEGEQQTSTIDCKAGCSINVPGPGAALVWLDSEAKLFMGNSTIAPYQYSSNEMRGSILSDMTTWMTLAPVVFGTMAFVF